MKLVPVKSVPVAVAVVVDAAGSVAVVVVAVVSVEAVAVDAVVSAAVAAETAAVDAIAADTDPLRLASIASKSKQTPAFLAGVCVFYLTPIVRRTSHQACFTFNALTISTVARLLFSV
jgi:hypothetical protein